MGQVQSCECTSSVNLQSSGSWYHHFVTPWYPDLELHRFLIIRVIILPSILDDLCFCSMICDSLVLKLIVAFLRNCQNKTLTIGFCSFSAMGNGLWLFSVRCMCWFSSPFLGSCIFFFFMKCFLDFPTLAGKIVIIITSCDASSENFAIYFYKYVSVKMFEIEKEIYKKHSEKVWRIEFKLKYWCTDIYTHKVHIERV